MDHFWNHWGQALRVFRPDKAIPTPTVPSHETEPASTFPGGIELAEPPVLSPESIIAPAAIPVLTRLALTFYQTSFPRIAPRVYSFTFEPPAMLDPVLPADHPPATSVALSQVRFPRRCARANIPRGTPLRDRVQTLLQPPLEAALGDTEVWLPARPFEYQLEGIQFLAGRWGALLADEMGLGKTIQTIVALRLLVRAGLVRSTLLVCPKPLVTNWVREFRRWGEEIPVRVIAGDAWQRRHGWLHDRSPVKLANYESLTRDADLLDEMRESFDLVVLDEAQRIKNRDSKTAGVVHALRRRRAWALTGTPIENHARELFSLLEFVRQEPNDWGDQTAALRDAVSEVLLRRTKEMVLPQMPPNIVNDLCIDLGPEQQARYESAEKDGVFQLNDLGDGLTIEHVFELIRRLKQICNRDPVTGASTKADHLEASLEEIAASGRKAIVFSQWVTTLDWLQDRLREYRPLVYHGGVPQRQRDGVLAQFRAPDRPVLLLSYGAGAVGLNLQFANYVFLFDRWWNPAIEDQAINRAHRIGQSDTVFIVRYLTPGTIEQRIAEILEHKRGLFAALIEDHDPAKALGLSREEVFGLFDLRVRAAGSN